MEAPKEGDPGQLPYTHTLIHILFEKKNIFFKNTLILILIYKKRNVSKYCIALYKTFCFHYSLNRFKIVLKLYFLLFYFVQFFIECFVLIIFTFDSKRQKYLNELINFQERYLRKIF